MTYLAPMTAMTRATARKMESCGGRADALVSLSGCHVRSNEVAHLEAVCADRVGRERHEDADVDKQLEEDAYRTGRSALSRGKGRSGESGKGDKVSACARARRAGRSLSKRSSRIDAPNHGTPTAEPPSSLLSAGEHAQSVPGQLLSSFVPSTSDRAMLAAHTWTRARSLQRDSNERRVSTTRARGGRSGRELGGECRRTADEGGKEAGGRDEEGEEEARVREPERSSAIAGGGELGKERSVRARAPRAGTRKARRTPGAG